MGEVAFAALERLTEYPIFFGTLHAWTQPFACLGVIFKDTAVLFRGKEAVGRSPDRS
jgi:hypothetical protein